MAVTTGPTSRRLGACICRIQQTGMLMLEQTETLIEQAYSEGKNLHYIQNYLLTLNKVLCTAFLLIFIMNEADYMYKIRNNKFLTLIGGVMASTGILLNRPLPLTSSTAIVASRGCLAPGANIHVDSYNK